SCRLLEPPVDARRDKAVQDAVVSDTAVGGDRVHRHCARHPGDPVSDRRACADRTRHCGMGRRQEVGAASCAVRLCGGEPGMSTDTDPRYQNMTWEEISAAARADTPVVIPIG